MTKLYEVSLYTDPDTAARLSALAAAEGVSKMRLAGLILEDAVRVYYGLYFGVKVKGAPNKPRKLAEMIPDAKRPSRRRVPERSPDYFNPPVWKGKGGEKFITGAPSSADLPDRPHEDVTDREDLPFTDFPPR